MLNYSDGQRGQGALAGHWRYIAGPQPVIDFAGANRARPYLFFELAARRLSWRGSRLLELVRAR